MLSVICFIASFMMSPHLTPEKLVGTRFSKDTFAPIKVALVGYCPPPKALLKYAPMETSEQYFIHMSPASVQIGEYQGIKFLSLFHVYGGPVSSALVEELAYYGIEYILAYGLAGGLGTKGLKMGDYYLINTAHVKDGTTPHYTKESLVDSSHHLNEVLLELAQSNSELSSMQCVKAVTDDAIYREYESELQEAIALGCDIVNCDSTHLFAACNTTGIATTECGVISDVANSHDSQWESTLSGILTETNGNEINPLERVGNIVEFYVETLLPKLVTSP